MLEAFNTLSMLQRRAIAEDDGTLLFEAQFKEHLRWSFYGLAGYWVEMVVFDPSGAKLLLEVVAFRDGERRDRMLEMMDYRLPPAG